ncbi:MAG: hypothetical protein H6825_08375 [Planctomycetes bacterium]|nr:hypothetical protein [Planctomycetota bacterium]
MSEPSTLEPFGQVAPPARGWRFNTISTLIAIGSFSSAVLFWRTMGGLETKMAEAGVAYGFLARLVDGPAFPVALAAHGVLILVKDAWVRDERQRIFWNIGLWLGASIVAALAITFAQIPLFEALWRENAR